MSSSNGDVMLSGDPDRLGGPGGPGGGSGVRLVRPRLWGLAAGVVMALLPSAVVAGCFTSPIGLTPPMVSGAVCGGYFALTASARPGLSRRGNQLALSSKFLAGLLLSLVPGLGLSVARLSDEPGSTPRLVGLLASVMILPLLMLAVGTAMLNHGRLGGAVPAILISGVGAIGFFGVAGEIQGLHDPQTQTVLELFGLLSAAIAVYFLLLASTESGGRQPLLPAADADHPAR